ncbi:hypothetical protein ACFSM5_06050 [Lacibacterium aquatile]|uniref:Uncharacterized protein n=1 Tax=Lacibacterium aquatile TaxID=1168082 RepID=A0ABW5DNF2_9PROT
MTVELRLLLVAFAIAATALIGPGLAAADPDPHQERGARVEMPTWRLAQDPLPRYVRVMPLSSRAQIGGY